VEVNPGPLVLLSLNVNSLSSLYKRDLFRGFLACLTKKPHVIALQETKLGSDFLDSELPLQDYQIFRRDRNEFGGGLLTAVAKGISVVKAVADVDSELLTVTTQCGPSQVVFVNVYRPVCTDRVTIDSLARHLPVLSGKISNRVQLVCCGDFNTPDYFPTVVPRLTSLSSRLFDCMADNFLENIVMYPTRLERTLDLIFVSHVQECSTVAVGGISDHLGNLMVMETCGPSGSKGSRHQERFFRNFDKVDLDLGIQISAEFCSSFFVDFDSRTVSENYQLIKEACATLLSTCVPEQRIWGGIGDRSPPAAIRKEIDKKMRLHKDSSEARKRMVQLRVGHAAGQQQHHRDPELIAAFQVQRRLVKRLLRRERRQQRAAEAKLAQTAIAMFWKVVNRHRKRTCVVPTLVDGVRLCATPELKAELLADSFSASFKEEAPLANMGVTAHRFVESIPDLVFHSFGVKELLKRINFRKAAGPDGVSSRILKIFGSCLAVPITRFFQQSYDTGVLPPDWTHAIVHPIPKKGARSDPRNYRPISLTSQLCKIFEHIIVSNVHRHLAAHNLLVSSQHGFRKKRSCETAIVSTLHKWADPLDQGSSIDAIFLDFAKAFDRVPHRRLLIKLDLLGIRGPYAIWIANFLRGRTFAVRVDGVVSQTKNVVSGVPQGTVLGPLLFILFINDLVRKLRNDVVIYADDVMLSAPLYSTDSCILLQHDICILQEWNRIWDLPFNISKCESMRITLPRKTASMSVPPFRYSVGTEGIAQVSSIKYLGVTLTDTLSFTAHIENIVKKANGVIALLKRNFSQSPRGTRRRLYMALVLPILESGSCAWDPYLKGDVLHLERAQNRAARFIAGDYSWSSSVTAMKEVIGLVSLENRRKKARMALLNRHLRVQSDLILTGFPVFRTSVKEYQASFRRLEGKHSFLHRTVLEARSVHDDGG
jgi:hypothetical protein